MVSMVSGFPGGNSSCLPMGA
uniref:Uncharacterized protein n=1 Tax=Anguilla anguilla TaxID=7936 RepID=A0A0E9SJN8_ANGAN